MRIAVCRPQVPFAHGGAEIFTDALVEELVARGHEAEIVSVPFKWYPGEQVLTQAFLWRLLDLTETDGRPIDIVVGTKFPSYLVRHPDKRVWLIHQFRQAYELDRTDLGQFSESAEDRAIRRKVERLDRVALGEATRLFTTSANVAARLERSTGLHGEVLNHPPQQLDYRCDGYGDFVLSANRLDRAKRVELLIEAVASTPALSAVITSDGPDRARLEQLARDRGVNGRVRFEGMVDRPRLAELYATCSSVFYAPVDEDYGMGPYEAFLACKPVITATDAGGPLDVVRDGETGRVVAPDAKAVAEAAAWLHAHPAEAERMGRAGQLLAERITWDDTIGRLIG
ncbi:MAG: glycosyltransferase family 4 protein [Gaiella sp.]